MPKGKDENQSKVSQQARCREREKGRLMTRPRNRTRIMSSREETSILAARVGVRVDNGGGMRGPLPPPAFASVRRLVSPRSRLLRQRRGVVDFYRSIPSAPMTCPTRLSKLLILAYRFKIGDDRCGRDPFCRSAVERLREWPGLRAPSDPREDSEEAR